MSSLVRFSTRRAHVVRGSCFAQIVSTIEAHKDKRNIESFEIIILITYCVFIERTIALRCFKSVKFAIPIHKIIPSATLRADNGDLLRLYDL